MSFSSASSAPYRALPLGSSRPHGWLAAQARQNLDGFVGQLPALCPEVGGDVFADGRLGPDSSAGGQNVAGVDWWNGESEGNWLLGYLGHALMTGDRGHCDEVARRLDAAVAGRDASGYLGMFTEGARESRPWIGGDLWAQSRILLALQGWAEATDDGRYADAVDEALAEAIARLGHAGDQAWEASTGDSCSRGHDLQIVEVAIAAAHRTGDRRYLDFAQSCYALFSAADLDWTESDCQLPSLLGNQPFVGHGAHSAENLRIPLMIFELTGDSRLLEAFRNGWSKILDGCGVTGALRSDETIGAPGERPMPFPEAGNEYCAITELTMTAMEAARITGDLSFVDVAESLFLNAAQAARANDGGGIGYFFAENQPAATHAMGLRWDISPTHDDAAVCCVPNAGRILPFVVDRAVLATEGGASVQYYGPITTRLWQGAHQVTISQRTAFPFEETVEVSVTGAPAGFELELRVPGWCPAATVRGFAGARVESSPQRVTVSGEWPGTAIIGLTLPQPVSTRHSIDGRVALAVGPLVCAWPIEYEERHYRSYPGSSLADRDFYPTSEQQLFPPVIDLAALSSVVVQRAAVVGDDPWTTSPLTTSVCGLNPNPRQPTSSGMGLTEFELVPIGATSMRWTCLPMLPGTL